MGIKINVSRGNEVVRLLQMMMMMMRWKTTVSHRQEWQLLKNLSFELQFIVRIVHQNFSHKSVGGREGRSVITSAMWEVENAGDGHYQGNYRSQPDPHILKWANRTSSYFVTEGERCSGYTVIMRQLFSTYMHILEKRPCTYHDVTKFTYVCKIGRKIQML